MNINKNTYTYTYLYNTKRENVIKLSNPNNKMSSPITMNHLPHLLPVVATPSELPCSVMEFWADEKNTRGF